MNSGPGYEALRRGRFSQPRSRYFLTLATQSRKTALNAHPVAPAVKREIVSLELDGSWQVHAGAIMPDHLHLLFSLGNRLTLGQSVARLKAKTRPALAKAGLGWQGNYFDHHLRPDDQIEDILRYIFLNPYRAKLIPSGETYPWTWLGAEEQGWFMPLTDDGRPFPEWLR